MIAAPLPVNEKDRLEALKRYGVLDSPAEHELEEIVQLASAICQTPISLVSLIDENRQWFKARIGLEVPETNRDIAFCSHVLLEEDMMVVENALEDERFSDNPLVTHEPNIRFYAGTPLITPDGFKLGTLCIIDKQPRKLTEQQRFALKTLSKQVIKHFELSLQNKKLRELSQLQTRFLSILSHDMRNPLLGIGAVLDLMKEGEINQKDFSLLMKEASVQVDNVLNLLNDIMEWASKANSSELSKETFNLHKLAVDCIELTKTSAQQKNNALHMLIPENFFITADQEMIKLILRNLISNAIKFTENGSITIQVEDTGTHWRVSVTDTGVGMSDEHMKRLLNSGKRFTTYGTKNEKGTGLGLFLCDEFVRKHGGELHIASTAGQGSAFSFTIRK